MPREVLIKPRYILSARCKKYGTPDTYRNVKTILVVSAGLPHERPHAQQPESYRHGEQHPSVEPVAVLQIVTKDPNYQLPHTYSYVLVVGQLSHVVVVEIQDVLSVLELALVYVLRVVATDLLHVLPLGDVEALVRVEIRRYEAGPGHVRCHGATQKVCDKLRNYFCCGKLLLKVQIVSGEAVERDGHCRADGDGDIRIGGQGGHKDS
jgi:hypothetical protein